MRSGIAEWTMALATLTTAVVIGVQSFSIRKSLDSNFAGNLQNREITVCENSVISIKRSSDVIRKYLRIAPRASLDLADDDSVASAIAKYPLSVGEDISSHEQILSDTRAQLALLQFYASPETSMMIDKMENGVGRIQQLINVADTYWRNPQHDTYDLMETFKPNPGTEPREWLGEIFLASDDFFNGIIDINNRCAQIVLGERRGLI